RRLTPQFSTANPAKIAGKSVSETVDESMREKQSATRVGERAVDVPSRSLSLNKHIQAEAEDGEELRALIEALDAHCTPPKTSERKDSPRYARLLLEMGATSSDRVRHAVATWKHLYCKGAAQPPIPPRVLYEHWDALHSAYKGSLSSVESVADADARR